MTAEEDLYNYTYNKISSLLEQRTKYYVNADIVVPLEGTGADAETGAPSAVVMHRLLKAVLARIQVSCTGQQVSVYCSLWEVRSRPASTICQLTVLEIGTTLVKTQILFVEVSSAVDSRDSTPSSLTSSFSMPTCILSHPQETKEEREAKRNFTIEYADTGVQKTQGGQQTAEE